MRKGSRSVSTGSCLCVSFRAGQSSSCVGLGDAVQASEEFACGFRELRASASSV